MLSREGVRIPSPPRILVVDDEKLVRLALAFELAEHGYEVIEAEDGASALAALADDVQALVLDYDLPDTDGICLLGDIAVRRPDLRAVLVTAEVDASLGRRAEAAGFVELVAKPFEPVTVARAVDAAVRARGAHSAAPREDGDSLSSEEA